MPLEPKSRFLGINNLLLKLKPIVVGELMEELYKRYWKLLVLDAYYRLGDMGLAEDCAQEAFLLLFSKLCSGAQFADDNAQRAFLLRSCRYISMHMLREREQERKALDQASNMEIDIEKYLTLENQEILDSALASMPFRNAVYTVWHYGYDATYEQMANRLGESREAVKKKTERAMKDLKKAMEERENDKRDK